jgi:hypothetical protein
MSTWNSISKTAAQILYYQCGKFHPKILSMEKEALTKLKCHGRPKMSIRNPISNKKNIEKPCIWVNKSNFKHKSIEKDSLIRL